MDARRGQLARRITRWPSCELGASNPCPDRERVGLLAPQPADAATGAVYPGLVWQDPTAAAAAGGPRGRIAFVDVVISSGSLVRGSASGGRASAARLLHGSGRFELCLRIRREGFLIGVADRLRSPAHNRLTPAGPRVRDHAGTRQARPVARYGTTRPETSFSWRGTSSPVRARGATRCGNVPPHGRGGGSQSDKQREAGADRRGVCDGLAGRLGMRVPPPTRR